MDNVTPIAPGTPIGPPKERSDTVRALRAAALKFANQAGDPRTPTDVKRVLKLVAADYRACADYIQNLEQQLGALREENRTMRLDLDAINARQR